MVMVLSVVDAEVAQFPARTPGSRPRVRPQSQRYRQIPKFEHAARVAPRRGQPEPSAVPQEAAEIVRRIARHRRRVHFFRRSELRDGHASPRLPPRTFCIFLREFSSLWAGPSRRSADHHTTLSPSYSVKASSGVTTGTFSTNAWAMI
jgi:hypothetical protein